MTRHTQPFLLATFGLLALGTAAGCGISPACDLDWFESCGARNARASASTSGSGSAIGIEAVGVGDAGLAAATVTLAGGEPTTAYSDLVLVTVSSEADRGRVTGVVPVTTTDAAGRFVAELDGPAMPGRCARWTVLLVRDFDGAKLGADGLDLDRNDDGAIDQPAWSELLDRADAVPCEPSRVPL